MCGCLQGARSVIFPGAHVCVGVSSTRHMQAAAASRRVRKRSRRTEPDALTSLEGHRLLPHRRITWRPTCSAQPVRNCGYLFDSHLPAQWLHAAARSGHSGRSNRGVLVGLSPRQRILPAAGWHRRLDGCQPRQSRDTPTQLCQW